MISESVKSARRSKLTMAALFVASVSSCGPLVENAPFSAGQTRCAGRSSGPFDGLVVDGNRAAVGRRGGGGIVGIRAWHRPARAGSRARAATETGADGRYRLRIPADLPRGEGSVCDDLPHRLPAWLRGLRSDGSFPRVNRATTSPSVQIACVWRNGSLPCPTTGTWFPGGGSAIHTAAAWEVQPAGLELMVLRRPPLPSARRKAHGRFLGRTRHFAASVRRRVRGATGYAGKFEVASWLTEPPATSMTAATSSRRQARDP